MSRINEAFRRTSPDRRRGEERPFPSVGTADPSATFTLEHYPVERRLSTARAPAAAAPQLRAVAAEEHVAPDAQDAQYVNLAGAVAQARRERSVGSVLMTGTGPHAGQAMSVVRLAQALGSAHGLRVLLVDADLCAPSVHELVCVRNDEGLSDVLAGAAWEPVSSDVSPFLTVVPAGRPAPGCVAALASARMAGLVADWTRQFDVVLLNGPALDAHADAPLLGHLVQAVVVVIDARSASLPAISRAMASVGRDRVLGTLVNGVDDAPAEEPARSSTD